MSADRVKVTMTNGDVLNFMAPTFHMQLSYALNCYLGGRWPFSHQDVEDSEFSDRAPAAVISPLLSASAITNPARPHLGPLSHVGDCNNRAPDASSHHYSGIFSGARRLGPEATDTFEKDQFEEEKSCPTRDKGQSQ